MLPIRSVRGRDEALDGYLERLAEANGISTVQVLRRVDPPIRRRADLLARDRSPGAVKAAIRAWTEAATSAICPACLAVEGRWRSSWRQPWVIACATHNTFLATRCPACGLPFRSFNTPLRPVDADAGTCGNPNGVRGASCMQVLAHVPVEAAEASLVGYIGRVNGLISTGSVLVLGHDLTTSQYIEELGGLTVLMLHLAALPNAPGWIPWAAAAVQDKVRSPKRRGARWGIMPPDDLRLRASALAAADSILAAPTFEDAAAVLAPWVELAPNENGTQLRWLADHTVMTPLLTRLVMAAGSSRRRVSTLLGSFPPFEVDTTAIPQVIAADLYAPVAALLEVTEPWGRLFVSLSIARRHGGCRTWAAAAQVLGLEGGIGKKAASASTSKALCSAAEWVTAVDTVAERLDSTVDYRAREVAVRLLVYRSRWHQQWTRAHHPGGHAATKPYAITWLWTEYAHGRLDESPGWTSPPDQRQRGYYRNYATRLSPDAGASLEEIAADIRPHWRDGARTTPRTRPELQSTPVKRRRDVPTTARSSVLDCPAEATDLSRLDRERRNRM